MIVVHGLNACVPILNARLDVQIMNTLDQHGRAGRRQIQMSFGRETRYRRRARQRLPQPTHSKRAGEGYARSRPPLRLLFDGPGLSRLSLEYLTYSFKFFRQAKLECLNAIEAARQQCHECN